MHLHLNRGKRSVVLDLRNDEGKRVFRDTPIAPVNTPRTLPDDPQFADRLGWIPASRLGADQLPFPVRFVGEQLPLPERAPTAGEHTNEVLRAFCDYDDAEVAALRKSGALGQSGASG
jgi:crotonobetainyl-CoA:carnitine CoA-transferase CaiB-like acyl-CoA transferase